MTPTPAWLWPVAGGMVIGLIIGLTLGRGRPVDPVVLHRVDSVLSESPAHQAERDSLRMVTVQSQRRAADLQGEAHRLRRVADSLKTHIVAVSPDTVKDMSSYPTVPRVAYDTLATAYATLETAYQSQMEATVSLRAEAGLAQLRIATLENTLRTAQAELKRTKKPSRWGLSCVGGYGAVSVSRVVQTGPALACGVSYRLR